MTAVTARGALPVDDTPVRARSNAAKHRASRIGLGLVAAVLVVAAWRLPIWEARLSAPQYPEGLSLTASASGVVGDIAEINELNHYVGMRVFDSSDTPEMKLWLPVILLGLLGVAIATSLPRRHAIGRLARLGIWLIPIGALADIQFRLYQYGHSVRPDAAIRLEPFTPLAVGPTKILNFTTWAYPGAALWCLFGAAFLLTWWSGTVGLARRAIDAYRRWGVEDEEEA
jgi:hypothetical protein